MASEKKISKRDREVLVMFDGQVKDIRQQLNDQLKCLDIRVETQVALVAEVQDYFRRRAEVELEYSRSLEKLAKSILLKHKSEKPKRDQWHLFSSYSCWQHLLATTKRQSRDHAVLSEIYANNLIGRFTHLMEDVQRIYRRCRGIGMEQHEELLKVLHELHTTMKTYHTYHTEEQQTEMKLRYVVSQRTKLEQSIPKEKLEKSKKFRLVEKEIQKRQSKYNDARLKALKARNDYLLCMDAANTAVQKYFVDDLSDLIDCMDFGFHTCLSRTLLMYVSSEECLKKSLQSSIDGMNKSVNNLDSRVDKQRFLEYNNSAFMVPKKFEFQPHKGDEVNHVSVERNIQDELEQRFKQLRKRLTTLKTENEEVWKTLETAEKSLMDMISAKDYDCTPLFEDENNSKNGLRQPETLALKLRADKQETEDFYLDKFREYTLGCNLVSRLQSKAELMKRALGADDEKEDEPPQPSPIVLQRPHSLPQKSRKKRIGRQAVMGQTKLFSGSLEEYIEATNQEIPLVVKSCIRIINLYGLHHQGVFRVSGSQVEINNFKEAFERGEDPLADVTDASDINSVAGVLKLYLRELREPLFPIFYFEQLMEISLAGPVNTSSGRSLQQSELESKKEFICKVRDVVKSLSRPVFVVLRYLFAFLNHLSEFSDENMMDPYNLAICFGPTLVPIPEDKDQVQYQNLVNELVKSIIIYQEEIFPDDGGTVYEKYISTDVPDENDVGESPPDQGSDQIEDIEVDSIPNEDETLLREQEIAINLFGKAEVLEAVAQYDFAARSDRELSFKKGDSLVLYTQVSNDWWKGNFNGKDGLIPDKYILLKMRDEDKDKLSSDGSEKRRTSSSSDSLSGISPSPKPSRANRIPEEEGSSSLSVASQLSSSQPGSQSSSPMSLNDPKGRRRSLSPSSLAGLRPVDPDIRKLRPSTSVSEVLENSSCSSLELASYDISNEHSNTELAKDLDNALARVYTSIDSIERKKKLERQDIKLWPSCTDAPDLVMDLPVNPSSPTASNVFEAAEKEEKTAPLASGEPSPVLENSDVMTTAERFALSNQCTMKKGSTMTRGSRPSAAADHGPPEVHQSPYTTYRRSSCTGTEVMSSFREGGSSVKELKRMFTCPTETTSDTRHSETSSRHPPEPSTVQQGENESTSGVSSFKPAVKAKPALMRKPVGPHAHSPSPEPVRREKEYKQTSF